MAAMYSSCSWSFAAGIILVLKISKQTHMNLDVLLTVHLSIFVVLLTVHLSIFIVLLTVHLVYLSFC